MGPEDLERAVEFMIKQQAVFESRLTALDVRMDRLAAAQERTVSTVALISEALVATINRLNQLTERVDAIGERLDAFIVVVERYISRNGNGGGSKPG